MQRPWGRIVPETLRRNRGIKRSKRVRGGEGREVTAAFCQDPVGHREDFGFYAE